MPYDPPDLHCHPQFIFSARWRELAISGSGIGVLDITPIFTSIEIQ